MIIKMENFIIDEEEERKTVFKVGILLHLEIYKDFKEILLKFYNL